MVFVALAGCRALHEEQVEQRLVQTRLRLADIPLPLSQVDALLASRQGVSRLEACSLCVDSVSVEGNARTYCLTTGAQSGCVVARAVTPEVTRFEPDPRRPELPLAVARALWRLVDPNGAQVATRELATGELSSLAIEEEERFTPRSSWFARATLSGTMVPYQTYFTLGLSAGVREWLGYFLVVGAGVSLEWSLFARPTVVGVPVRAELTLWSDELGARWNLPAASFLMTMTPLIAFGDGPDAAFGARGTIGVQLTKPQAQWIPIALELGYQAVGSAGANISGPRVALSFGL